MSLRKRFDVIRATVMLTAAAVTGACSGEVEAKEGPFASKSTVYMCAERDPGDEVFFMSLGGLKNRSFIEISWMEKGSWPDQKIQLVDVTKSGPMKDGHLTFVAEGPSDARLGSSSGKKYAVALELIPKANKDPAMVNVDITLDGRTFRALCADPGSFGEPRR